MTGRAGWQDLVFDWNEAGRAEPPIPPGDFLLVDETLRDGIQSPSVRNPAIEEKIELLHLMAACGIEVADVGLPGAGVTAVEDCAALVREIEDQHLRIQPTCAARTHPADVRAVVEVAQRAGRPIEVCAFLGSSPVRRLIEHWDLDHMVGLVEATGDVCQREGLPFSFVTEDTTRADPETLRVLFTAAINRGATRLVICDTVGHCTPDGQLNLLHFVQSVIADAGMDGQIGLDWHGHNDRGLSLTLALSALEYGFDRVHGTCLGVGERVGNASIDQLLVNLKLLRIIDRDLVGLGDYCRRVSEVYEVPIPYNYPVFGGDAFRTATGVHAAAIVKALAAGRPDLADQVYSSVPARDVGCSQRVDVGYYSGRANAQCWLHLKGLEVSTERVAAILDVAKAGRHTLTEEEILQALLEAGQLTAEEVERCRA